MSFPLPPDALDRELVLNFFWRFSVFECALKRAGHLRAGRLESVSPDWNSFASAIEEKLRRLDHPGFRDGVATLLRLAPKQQIVRDGTLGWAPVSRETGQSDAAYSLQLLRTVRNNLFHGGKYPDGPIGDVSRDREILSAALAVLDGCYLLDPHVRRFVDEAA